MCPTRACFLPVCDLRNCGLEVIITIKIVWIIVLGSVLIGWYLWLPIIDPLQKFCQISSGAMGAILIFQHGQTFWGELSSFLCVLVLHYKWDPHASHVAVYLCAYVNHQTGGSLAIYSVSRSPGSDVSAQTRLVSACFCVRATQYARFHLEHAI